MLGICTGPATGAQVRPRLCSRPISAAYSTWRGVPPISWAAAPAAMAQATPTSPWQPTSAPEMDALNLARFPINPAVANAWRILPDVQLNVPCRYFKTAGRIPLEPQVGAVTITPPEAFSSE